MLTSKHLFQEALSKFPHPFKKNNLTNAEKITQISAHMASILDILGLDINNDSLKKTPERVAKMYVEEIFAGLDESKFPGISFFEDPASNEKDRLITLKNIRFFSFCEHHFVPMIGTATIAYIPNNRLIGFSKIHRIVHYFAQRPQLQERLTHQIQECLKIILGTEDMAVSLQAKHYCIAMRGIKDDNTFTITHALSGRIASDPQLRMEFFK
ncbi:MAG: GTP cyclohydrolase I FolE [Chlamydiae bacterium]|nr:GTP cyclohydrolase I FolE [Chlamydiota bacterium]